MSIKNAKIFFPLKFDSPVLERALCRQNRISSTQSKLNKFKSQNSKKRYFLAFILIIFNIRLFFYWNVSILFIFIVKVRQSWQKFVKIVKILILILWILFFLLTRFRFILILAPAWGSNPTGPYPNHFPNTAEQS